MRVSKADREEAIGHLRRLLKPGSTVLCVLRHVSRSGMSRRIDFYTQQIYWETDDRQEEPKASLAYLSGYISTVLGMTRHRDSGLVVGGCGMDAGFGVVYNLSHALFKDGFTCLRERCPSNDHSNGDRNRKPHAHSSGGYALRHEWL